MGHRAPPSRAPTRRAGQICHRRLRSRTDLAHDGPRTFLLNASKLHYEDGLGVHILLAFEDVTDRQALERQRDELIDQKDLLLEEMQHRVANSLQIIASILLLKARTVPTLEIRAHLEHAHKRVLSVAEVQRHLRPADGGQTVDIGDYLTALCAGLAASMINDDACRISVDVVEGRATSAAAVSIGLIATELVINALKHAFPEPKPGRQGNVPYETNGSNWKMTIADNGIGKSDEAWPVPNLGSAQASWKPSPSNSKCASRPGVGLWEPQS